MKTSQNNSNIAHSPQKIRITTYSLNKNWQNANSSRESQEKSHRQVEPGAVAESYPINAESAKIQAVSPSDHKILEQKMDVKINEFQ